MLAAMALATMTLAQSPQQTNVVDEVVWVVGDEAIFRSDIEEQYNEIKLEGTRVPAQPYCAIPEQLAVEKLYLHQAKLDTIEPNAGMINANVEKRLNYFIAGLGSKERVEQYFHKTMPELRDQLRDVIRTQSIIQQVQQNLTKNFKSTPNDVRKYFNTLPEDSIPYIPLQVEAQIITFFPRVPQQEIDDVKARLRDYSERVNSGESDFSTLAIMYSEDDGSSMQGGELGFHGRADFVPEFSNVAFSLNDPKKVSRIVETEYGYHIIQLIEKRGDQVNVRHILIVPEEKNDDGTYTDAAWTAAEQKAQSLLDEWKAGEHTEDSFAFLAAENSADTGSASNGGLYEEVYPGQMVDAFDAWCFDAARQPGDTGIVKTEYGYHVMYFSSVCEHPYWYVRAESDYLNKLSADVSEEVSAKFESAESVQNAALADILQN